MKIAIALILALAMVAPARAKEQVFKEYGFSTEFPSSANARANGSWQRHQRQPNQDRPLWFGCCERQIFFCPS